MIVPPLNPALFHLDPDHLWLMHCAEGPVPRSVVKGIQDFLHKELRPWELRWNEDFLGIPQTLRNEAAKVLGVDHPKDGKGTGTLHLLVNPIAAQYAALGASMGELFVILREEGDAEIYPMEMSNYRALFR